LIPALSSGSAMSRRLFGSFTLSLSVTKTTT
jgi:hypothetical protein